MELKNKIITDVFPNLSRNFSNIFIDDVKIFKSMEKVLISLTSKNSIKEDQIFEIRENFLKNLEELDVEIEFFNFELESKEEEIKSFISKEFSMKDYQFKLDIEGMDVKLKLFESIDKEKLEELSMICNNLECNLIIEEKFEDKNIEDFLDRIETEENEIESKIQTVKEPIKKKINLVPTEDDGPLIYKKLPKNIPPDVDIKDLDTVYGNCSTSGIIYNIEFKEILNGEKEILTISYTDYTESTYVKIFLNKEDVDKYKNGIKEGMGIKVIGEMTYDTFVKSNYIKPSYFEIYDVNPREDLNDEKRIELHLHTSMSAQDGINGAEDYIKRAKFWGHDAIAITDHSVVQAFPSAMYAGFKYGVKILYGMEINLVDDYDGIIKDREYLDNSLDSFVIFDVETTGFSAKNDKIIEIGAIKIQNGEIIDSFNILINPKEPLKDEIIALTGITDSMLVNQPEINEVVDDFNKFISNSILVAHNASFDISFIKNSFERYGLEFKKPYIDTLELSRIFYPNVRSHSLGNVAKRLGVSLENAHRAVDDAKATGEIFVKLIEEGYKNNDFSDTLKYIESLIDKREKHMGQAYHAVILAKNLTGLKNLYKLVSLSHIDHFNYTPKVPKSVFEAHRDGLLISSACQDGELYQSIVKNYSSERIKKIVNYYDYLEIQPTKNNMNLIPEYFNTVKELEDINKQILKLGDEFGKLVVATGDVHYLDEELRESRKVLKHSVKNNRGEYDNDYQFLTTDEMLEEFSYLDSRAFEVVIRNPKKINEQIEEITPIPKGTYPPIIDGSDEMLKEMTLKKAHEIYGDPLPDYIEKRVYRELDAIIKNGYSVMYIIAQKLVQKSNEDGYQVGSRGSVGSSIVATLTGITEVNPLAPHYSCPNCKYSELIDMQKLQVFSGSDLVDKNCPKCSTPLNKYGDDIPFEVFLGFDGDKEPDIDLNFAGEYQLTAHKYTEELFGEGKVFRAGTIGTVAQKTAFGYVKKYLEETNKFYSKSEIDRLSKSLVGIKRTTGQHAGGIMVVPEYKEIHDFTPIQKPANSAESDIVTTHFDYNSISENILKLDILGHDVPSMIKMIEELTGTDFMKTPLNDKKVLSIFSSADALELDSNICDFEIGTLGVPEFGTNFVQRMLKATTPSTFAELVQISGLSHGTNVWTGNAEELVNSGSATLKEVISTREDIMQDLINVGAEKKFAFSIMEKVRKGKGLTPEEEEIIGELDLPDWYINSLNKISYMFPKAHAVAYVTMSVRLAYYKVYYPDAFYATFLSTKLENFDLATISQGPDAIIRKLKEIKNEVDLTAKEEKDIPIYEIALEMFARGCELGNIGLYTSEASKFTIIDGKIIPPFRVVPNLGLNVAEAISEESDKEEFLSIEDLVKRTRLSNTCIEYLKGIGVLEGLSESNQLSLF
ncbi:MAG: PolC-type DNA polymerase III [Tissierellia bacterium]|nr:PolC-type DNA polymerase III [Tissierellia bacterium]